jgi:hypothetical protein
MGKPVKDRGKPKIVKGAGVPVEIFAGENTTARPLTKLKKENRSGRKREELLP